MSITNYCECDNTHESAKTVCQFCYENGVRYTETSDDTVVRTWTKTPYGKKQNPETGEWEHDGGHWTLTNGHISFEVHVLFDGSGRREEYPDGVIVSPSQANEYADKILTALNHYGVDVA